MNITRIQTYLTHKNTCDDGWIEIKSFLLVCLETDNGLKGWGEAFLYAENGPDIEALLLSLGQQVIEQSDINPHSFHQQFREDIESRGFGFSCAMSAIEIALWDLQGKLQSQPVYELIGTPRTRDIPVYANTWSGKTINIATLVSRCQALVGQGHNAVKIYPLKYGSAENAGECLKIVRETLGNDIDILLDLSAINDPGLALACAEAVAPYRPYWFEEPHSGDDLETLADIRRISGLRIVTGEKHTSQRHFKNVLNLQAADILNPDIAACGGILEILEIGSMAESYTVTVSPHCWNSMTAALAAMLQVCAVMPNAEKAEFFPSFLVFGKQFCRTDFDISNGVAKLGKAPGLGIEIDDNALAKLSTKRSIH